MPTRNLLFIITSDPRESARPAEAIRMAAGIGAWKKVNVRIYFHGAAVLSFSEWTDELVDEESFRRYLPLLGEEGGKLFTEKGSAVADELGVAPVAFESLDEQGLSKLAAASDSVLRF
jgi:hypothetical protein